LKKFWGDDGLVSSGIVRRERNVAVYVWVGRNRASTYSERSYSLAFVLVSMRLMTKRNGDHILKSRMEISGGYSGRVLVSRYGVVLSKVSERRGGGLSL
jgi:hypothetical protein